MNNKTVLKFVTGALFFSVAINIFACGTTSSTSSIKPTINDMYLDEVNELLDSKFTLEFDENDKDKIIIHEDEHEN